MAIKEFDVLSALLISPPVVYCDVCGQVMLKSMASAHPNKSWPVHPSN